MSIDRISNGPLGPIDRSPGQGHPPEAVGEAGARAIAFAVVARIAGEMGLGQASAEPDIDPFRLRDIGAAVLSYFPAGPAAVEGELHRAIEGLAGAISADMVARADGGTLDRVESALSNYEPSGGSDQGVAAVAAFLERATAVIADAT